MNQSRQMMIKQALILVFLLETSRQEGCNFALFRSWDPVVLSTDFNLVYPPLENVPGDRNFSLPAGETVIISCDGGRFEGINTTSRTVLATCNQDFEFEFQDTIVDISRINCINFKPVVAKATSARCGPDASLIRVGFHVGLNIRHVPQIDVCFDVVKLNPLYTYHNLTKSIGSIKSYLTTRYTVDWVYNVSLDFDQIYDYDYQQKTINDLLGLPVNSTNYVNPSTCRPNPGLETPGFCFSRRHLTYRGNLVYIPQQYATYRYINVAPQWYFIDYNLNQLEYDVVDFVKINKIDLEVYTGTWGVATLPHATTGEAVELFLYVGNNVKVIPVPLIFWKILYDCFTLRATVFLIVNDPYQSDVTKNVICDDISDQITWLNWEKHNVTKGYSYACAYGDVKNVITYLPELEVSGTLGTNQSVPSTS